MGRWRSLRELRQAFAESGIDLGRPGHPQRKSCRGKIRHKTREDAERHIRDLQFNDSLYRRRYRKIGELEIYKCKGCGAFHVGHAGLRKGAT